MKIESFHNVLLENGFTNECIYEHFANYQFRNGVRLRIELDNKGFMYAYAFKVLMVPEAPSLTVDSDRVILSDINLDIKYIVCCCEYLESFSFILSREGSIWKC